MVSADEEGDHRQKMYQVNVQDIIEEGGSAEYQQSVRKPVLDVVEKGKQYEGRSDHDAQLQKRWWVLVHLDKRKEGIEAVFLTRPRNRIAVHVAETQYNKKGD